MNEIDENGDWPLQLALSSKQKSIAETLVSHGVDVNGCDKNQQTHLHRALEAGMLTLPACEAKKMFVKKIDEISPSENFLKT